MASRKLYKVADGKWIGGVAGGFARFFGIDRTIVRIIFAGMLMMGIGIPFYLICWLVIPRDPDADLFRSGPGIFGILLRTILIIGAFALLTNALPDAMGPHTFVLGAVIGLLFYVGSRWGTELDGVSLFGAKRSAEDKKVAGVFGGIAELTGIEPTLLRILGVVLLIAAPPVTLAGYILLAVVLPRGEQRAVQIQ